jgi:hypothetical protein
MGFGITTSGCQLKKKKKKKKKKKTNADCLLLAFRFSSFFLYSFPAASLPLPLTRFISSIPISLISLSSSVAPVTFSLIISVVLYPLTLILSIFNEHLWSLPLIYFFVMFLDLLFSKLDLYASGSQIHQRTTPPGSWAFQLSAAVSCATIRPPEAGTCSSRANRSSIFSFCFLCIYCVFRRIELKLRARLELELELDSNLVEPSSSSEARLDSSSSLAQ